MRWSAGNFGSAADSAQLAANLAKVRDFMARTRRVPFVGEYGAMGPRDKPEDDKWGWPFKSGGYVVTRIDRRFEEVKRQGRAALVTFVTAGDPDYETSLAIIKGLPKAGADIIEFGMPFTDPMADGPAIQAAGLRALRNGRHLASSAGRGRLAGGAQRTALVIMQSESTSPSSVAAW